MPDTLGIYISIPFCRAKCSYCNFASGVFGSERMAAYIERLTAEIRASRNLACMRRAVLPETVDSIYFGGGTPSLLSPEQMQRIMTAVQEIFRIGARAEITLECAPGHLIVGLLQALPEFGFNRVSLGVQSFVDREAAAVGRSHTSDIVMEEIARLRRAGIRDINVDLIAGLPHQTIESWQESLDGAIASGVSHLSVYMLDVDEDSRLGREMLAGGTRYGVGLIPREEVIAAMYNRACEQFSTAGIAQYEISNFARNGYESRHNLKYWTRQPYLGFGLDAHSFLHCRDGSGVRVGNTDDLAQYLDHGTEEMPTPVTVEEAMEEAWFLGLRLVAGVSLREMQDKIGLRAMEACVPILAECEQHGLVERDGARVRLTQQGRLFANDVFARFMGVFHEEHLRQEFAKEGVLV
jgi:oxygen-independent coproporphyrinogen-3 oxidase